MLLRSQLRLQGAAAAPQGAVARSAAAAAAAAASEVLGLQPAPRQLPAAPASSSRSYIAALQEGSSSDPPPALHGSSGSGRGSQAWAPDSGGERPPQLRQVQLVRDFIHDSLYHPTQGYFSKHTATGAGVVGSPAHPLDFASFAGQTEYLLAVQALYKELQASWLTPVEIFQPHYGRALASCILGRWRALAGGAVGAGRTPPPLRIFEIGGGTGTLARNVLDWLRAEHPAAYAACRYSCVEISPVLAALQRAKVAQEGGHAARFSVRQHDAADAAAWAAADAAEVGAAGAAGPAGSAAGAAGAAAGTAATAGAAGKAQQHAFIVMCEVLDNLPHDRVVRGMGSTEWQQTLVAAEELPDSSNWQQRHLELLAPATDPLIRRCLRAVEALEAERANGGASGGGGARRTGLALAAARVWRRLMGEATEEIRWLPTGCLQLLDTLRQVRPSHTLLAADFDQLPEVSIPGVCAPLAATTVGGSTVDHASYLVPRGTADIFFPTDFGLLSRLYRDTMAQQGSASTGGGSCGSGAASPAAVAAAGAAAAAEPGGGAVAVTAEHLASGAFMAAHAPHPGATATRSGYNPLLDDYSNTAVFVGSRL